MPTAEEVHNLRILDPACGSGSFLIEAFDVLDRWLAQNGTEEDKNFPRRRRLRILQENLYGVDLDDQAVEVTRLNLMLRAALERSKLPLLTHIQHGNSLVDDPAVAGETAFKWEERFPEVMERGGFDVVVGNPPYVRQETLGAAFKGYAQTHYETFAGTNDLYVYFIEKGLKLLKPGGIYGVIVSSSFIKAAYGLPLRRHIRDKYALLQLVDFGGQSLFESAKDVYVCIPILSKQAQPEVVQVTKIASVKNLDLSSYVAQNQYPVPISKFSPEVWSLEGQSRNAVFEKIKAKGESLGQYTAGEIYRGILTGLNEAFVVNPSVQANIVRKSPHSTKLIHKFLGGQDIRRYTIDDSQRYIIVVPSGWTREQMIQSGCSDSEITDENAWRWFCDNHGEIAEHLNAFRDAAQKRQDKGEFWWELRPCVYYDVLDRPKIIYPDIAKAPRFVLDTSHTYIGNTAYCLGTDDKYLLGVLNSKLSWFAVSCISIPFGTRAGEFRYRMIYQYMEQLPIRRIHFDDPADRARHDKMVSLVETMLRLKQEHAQAEAVFSERRHELAEQIARTDQAIDALVYELYGLTEAEIAIVEGR